MKYQVCRGCGDHLDAGEAVNGYCRECLEEKEKRKDIVYRMQGMVASKEWLQENGYPTVIELELANGNVNRCRVVYGEVA